MNADPTPPENDFPAYAPAWPPAPPGFADRVTAAWIGAHRARRRRVWLARAGGLSLAASVALAVGFGLSATPRKPDDSASIPTAPAPVP